MVIAVDFDGTLCEHKFPSIGEPNHELIQKLIDLRRQGAKLILWTCRDGELLSEALVWCHQQGLDFDAANQNLTENIVACQSDPRKVFADIYLDDRAMRPGQLINLQT